MDTLAWVDIDTIDIYLVYNQTAANQALGAIIEYPAREWVTRRDAGGAQPIRQAPEEVLAKTYAAGSWPYRHRTSVTSRRGT
jgi:hypothetical protein